MLRNYIRKSNRGKGYTKESFEIALAAIKAGQLTLYLASKVYNIPIATLYNYLKDRKETKSFSHGRPQDIPLHEEK